MTLSLSDEVYLTVKAHREIRWSEIARRAIENYAKRLAVLDALAEDSELTEEDVMELDESIKEGMWKRYMHKKRKKKK